MSDLDRKPQTDAMVVLKALLAVGVFSAVLCLGGFFFIMSVCKSMKF